MSKVWTATGLTLALVAATACGKSAEQKRQEEAAKQLQEAAKKMEAAGNDAQKAAEKGAEGMAAGMEALAKGLGAAAGVANGGKTVDPLPFRDLQATFARPLRLGEDEADRREHDRAVQHLDGRRPLQEGRRPRSASRSPTAPTTR